MYEHYLIDHPEVKKDKTENEPERYEDPNFDKAWEEDEELNEDSGIVYGEEPLFSDVEEHDPSKLIGDSVPENDFEGEDDQNPQDVDALIKSLQKWNQVKASEDWEEV